MKKRLLKNAIANLCRGFASAAVAVALPPLLIRHMPPPVYVVWVLILQVTAYMGFLDFGLQTAVARYIAFAEEQKNAMWRDGIFSTALAGLSGAAFLGIVCLVGVAVFAGAIFPSIPAALLPSTRRAVLIVGISTAIGLPASAWNGVFVGRQRNEFPAATLSASRLCTSIGLVWAAIFGKSLVFMACLVGAINLVTYLIQYMLMNYMFPEVRFRAALITKTVVKELSGYCASLTVWQFGTLLVTGFDLILVGRFQYSRVAVYSGASVLITLLGGIQNSLFNVIMPHSAMLQASGSKQALGDLLLKCTRLATISILATGLPLTLFSFSIIAIWLGPQYAVGGSGILVVLVIGNMIRLLGVPYALILMGTGQQRLNLFSPMVEGITNLIASILLGIKFGAIGVAWGTLIGATAGIAYTLIYSVPKARENIYTSSRALIGTVASVVARGCLPVLLVLPFELIAPARNLILSAVALVGSVSICTILALKHTLPGRSEAL